MLEPACGPADGARWCASVEGRSQTPNSRAAALATGWRRRRARPRRQLLCLAPAAATDAAASSVKVAVALNGVYLARRRGRSHTTCRPSSTTRRQRRRRSAVEPSSLSAPTDGCAARRASWRDGDGGDSSHRRGDPLHRAGHRRRRLGAADADAQRAAGYGAAVHLLREPGARLIPASGPEDGGSRVVVSLAAALGDAPAAVCRFGNAPPVAAEPIDGSPESLLCTTPASSPGSSCRLRRQRSAVCGSGCAVLLLRGARRRRSRA